MRATTLTRAVARNPIFLFLPRKTRKARKDICMRQAFMSFMLFMVRIAKNTPKNACLFSCFFRQAGVVKALTLALIGCLLTGAAHAAKEVDLRLVRAHNREEVSAELKDVADLLRNNLPYRGFTLLGRAGLPLPNRGQTVTLPERLVVRGSGQQERFTIVVQRDKETLLNAVVTLRKGAPVILGGFPDGADRLLLVVVAR